MRKAALLLALVAVSAIAQAFGPSSSLRVHVPGYHQAVTVVINGQAFRPSSGTFSLNGIPPGSYPVRVFSEGPGPRALIFKGVVQVPAASNVTLSIGRNGRAVMRQVPYLPLPPRPVRPGLA